MRVRSRLLAVLLFAAFAAGCTSTAPREAPPPASTRPAAWTTYSTVFSPANRPGLAVRYERIAKADCVEVQRLFYDDLADFNEAERLGDGELLAKALAYMEASYTRLRDLGGCGVTLPVPPST